MSASRSVVSSAKLIAVCTLLSRVTGLVRDILLAQAFGLGWVQDAFNYAFQLPNLFRRLFGEGAMSPVFVPVFTQTLEREGRAAAWRMLARTIALMSIAIAVVIGVIVLVIAGVWLLAPVDPSKRAARELLLSLTLIMLPFMWSICILALLSSVLNCLGSFVPAALAPIVLNVGMIFVLGWLAPLLYPGDLPAQVTLAAWAVIVSGVLQLFVLMPALRREHVGLGFRLDWSDPAVRRMMTLLGPVALGQGVLAFGVFLDAQVCTLLTHVHGTAEIANWFGITFRYPLQEGALSAVTCAQRLYQFPLGVLVISLATAALPAFSRHAANQRWGEWGGEVRQTFRLAVFEGLLAGAMMIVIATPIVRLLFERGQFDAADTHRAARVLVCYGFGLWAFCAQHIVSRAFFSMGDVRTPLALSAAALPLNLLLNIVLVWFEPIGESAFAISSVITQSMTVVAGIALLERRLSIRVFTGEVLSAIGRMLLAAFIVGLLVALIMPWWSSVAALVPSTLLRRSIETLPPLAVGSMLFLLLARALGLGEPLLLIPRRFRQSVG